MTTSKLTQLSLLVGCVVLAVASASSSPATLKKINELLEHELPGDDAVDANLRKVHELLEADKHSARKLDKALSGSRDNPLVDLLELKSLATRCDAGALELVARVDALTGNTCCRGRATLPQASTRVERVVHAIYAQHAQHCQPIVSEQMRVAELNGAASDADVARVQAAMERYVRGFKQLAKAAQVKNCEPNHMRDMRWALSMGTLKGLGATTQEALAEALRADPSSSEQELKRVLGTFVDERAGKIAQVDKHIVGSLLDKHLVHRCEQLVQAARTSAELAEFGVGLLHPWQVNEYASADHVERAARYHFCKLMTQERETLANDLVAHIGGKKQ